MDYSLRVREIEFFERPVVLRLPFRFGIITLTEEPQIFVRTLVEFENGATAWGHAAEALAPKWFDKNPGRTNEENFSDLRNSLSIAASLYLLAGRRPTAFSFFAEHYENQLGGCEKQGLNHLVGSFGQALLDRCLIDAYCRFRQVPFADAVRSNLLGIHSLAETPELANFDMDVFLSSLEPLTRLHARHTIGMVDPITALDQRQRLSDGLPETLEEVIQFYGHTYFKIKVQGNLELDLDRLSAISAVLDGLKDPYFVTLDGNEQYEDADQILELWTRLRAEPRFRRFVDSILLIEQPIKRSRAMQDVSRLSGQCPVIIDESDYDLDAFPTARIFGYSGVSSKQCKGVYRSIMNAARCRSWALAEPAKRWIMTGEDLTIQGGVSLQQDLALAAILGLTHIERNGHHYVRGLNGASRIEQMAFLEAHPDLYVSEGDWVRVRIEDGIMRLGSLGCPGLGTQQEADWGAMARIR